MKIHAPKSHPRYLSLYYRDLLAGGVKSGLTSLQGLTAHGRGEAFDYLLGETSHPFALNAIRAAAALFLLSEKPVISVNGNTAVLVPEDLIRLSDITGAPLEVNLFHASKIRERRIARYLIKHGAGRVLLPDGGIIEGIGSNRKRVNTKGQVAADMVFVPLEDGDRTQALKKMGEKVITVDLNPLSRTAQKADITIVDNITRALPHLIQTISKLKMCHTEDLKHILAAYDNRLVLSRALRLIYLRLDKLAGSMKGC